MIEQGYKVIAEFRFDVASAVINSQTLQDEVGKISSAAETAQMKLMSLGASFMTEMGLGYLSVGAVILNAFKASEKFYQTQLKLSNVMLGSGLFKGENGFQESMLASADAMERMKRASREFALPAGAMVETSLGVGAALVNKHLDDSSLSKSVDLSRQYLKSAPILLQGQDPTSYIPQLIGAISGRADIGGTLIQRLIDETGAMGKFKGAGGIGKFNAMKDADRLDLLTKALAQFSGQGKVVAAMAKSLTGELQRLKDNLFGVFGVFNKIGDTLRRAFLPILDKANAWLEQNGEKIATSVSRMLDRVLKDPIKLWADFQQLRGLKSDVSTGASIIKMMMWVHAIASMAGFIGKIPFGPLQGAVTAILGVFKWVNDTIIHFLVPAASASGSWLALFGQVFAVFGFLVTMLQSMSRGLALAKVDNASWMLDNAARFTAVMDAFHQAIVAILSPFEMIIDGWAQLWRWVFSSVIVLELFTRGMEKFGNVLMFIGKVIVGFFAIISGIMQSMLQLVIMFQERDFSGFGKKMTGAFMEGFDLHFEKYFPKDKVQLDKVPVSGQNIQVDKVVINNQFKEQMEPDRIAFALKDQLMKAAANPLQASRTSMAGKGIR